MYFLFMVIRSKAPLRIGLAGGGTDVSPFCDQYGGYVLNVTTDLYAHCILEPTDDNKISFHSIDRKEDFESKSLSNLEIDGNLILHKGVYNRVVKDFNDGKPLSLKISTYSDVPAGSGLGSSSTMVVALLKAYSEWLNIPLGDYDLAELAYDIERVDLALSGGMQDQYAATFGGLNFMEFYDNKRVIVNPLRIKGWVKNELESSLLLYFMGASRDSAKIINEQVKNAKAKKKDSIQAMLDLKENALLMKEAILKGDLDLFASCLNAGWDAKKKMASVISNPEIEETRKYVLNHGGKAAKVSGAGGGGFMMIIADPLKKFELIESLKNRENGKVFNPSFIEKGVESWTIY